MGGAQYQIKCLLEYLQSLDKYEIDYIARRAPGNVEIDGYRIHRIGRGAGKPRFGYASDGPELYKALRQLRPHVIYQRVGCAYTGIAAYYSGRNGSRLLWHASSDADLARSKRIARHNLVQSFLEDSFLAYGIRHADRVVVQSVQQERLLADNYSRAADAIIANFHPLPTEARQSVPELRVLWIANFKRLKQPEVFVRLAGRLRDLSQVRFVMIGASAAGEGDADWSGDLLRQIDDTPNLEYLGGMSQDEVNSQLASAYALVNTSLYEGFPNTFIQAWFREVPVVSLNVDPDGILGRAAVGIRAGNEEALAASLRRLVSDRQLHDHLARNAHRHVHECHSIQNAQHLASIIDGLLEQRHGASSRSWRKVAES